MNISMLVGIGFLGAVTASFVGVISERVYTGQSWKKGRSKCNSCNQTLRTHDLIPVISWIIQKGRCSMCKSSIPVRYALTEAILSSLFVYGYIHLGLTLALLFFCITLSVLLFITVYDIRHTIVPPLASFLLLCSSSVFAYITTHDNTVLTHTILIALVVSGAFVLMHVLSKGRAMGLGDAPVVFALSLFTGVHAIPGLLFSFWSGALFGIILLLLRRGGPTMGIEVPFVPFMAFGYLLAYITQWSPFTFF
jgi:prepilin signal peptidase PulO-like enzyme (type II secretory pathway)